MDKVDWGKLGIMLFMCAVVAFFSYRQGKRHCEASHEIKLSRATDNILNYEAKRDSILGESDSAALQRGLDNYARSKR